MNWSPIYASQGSRTRSPLVMLNNGNIRQAQLDDGVTPRVVIGTLYFAREVLVPTALALLLSLYLRHSFELCGIGACRTLLR